MFPHVSLLVFFFLSFFLHATIHLLQWTIAHTYDDTIVLCKISLSLSLLSCHSSHNFLSFFFFSFLFLVITSTLSFLVLSDCSRNPLSTYIFMLISQPKYIYINCLSISSPYRVSIILDFFEEGGPLIYHRQVRCSDINIRRPGHFRHRNWQRLTLY